MRRSPHIHGTRTADDAKNRSDVQATLDHGCRGRAPRSLPPRAAVYGLIVDDARDASSDVSAVEPFDLRRDVGELDQRPPPGPPPGRAAEPAEVTPTTAPRPIPLPLTLRIPEVGIDTPLIPLGLNPDNTLEVPKDFALAGWFVHRSVPGEPGPSIIVGHVDSKRGPAVFYRLRDLGPGATIEVARSDGSIAKFTVVAKEQHDKDDFPTARSTDRPTRPSSG